jgi:hypothetical protein
MKCFVLPLALHAVYESTDHAELQQGESGFFGQSRA